MRVDEKKVKHWRSTLEELVATKTLELGMASKCAAPLSFAATVAVDQCGRAYRIAKVLDEPSRRHFE